MPNKKTKRRRTEENLTAVDANVLHSPQAPEDPEVRREFLAAGTLNRSGSRQLGKKLTENWPASPELTAGDLDAAWDRPDIGEEAPGGSVTTPDQDVVEEIGEAMGLTFEDDEPVDAPGKLSRRDRDRWELRPASSEDYAERQRAARTPAESLDGDESG